MSNGLQRLVILGHSGFIGSKIKLYFEKSSKYSLEVIGLSIRECNLEIPSEVSKLAPYLDGSTALIFCSGIKRQIGSDLETFEKNVRMVTNVGSLLQKHPIGRLIYFSSAAVYGEDVPHEHISETTPVCPTSSYGIAKFSSERLLHLIRQKGGCQSLVCLRPPTIYGPGEEAGAYSPSGFLGRTMAKEPIVLWGDGQELREFIFIDDVPKIIEALLFSSYEGALNLASGTSSTFAQALRILRQLLKEEIKIEERPRTKQRVDQVFNGELLRKQLPHITFTGLEEGMTQTLRHLKVFP